MEFRDTKYQVCANKECGATVRNGLTYCPRCGTLLPGQAEKAVISKQELEKLEYCQRDLTRIHFSGYEPWGKVLIKTSEYNTLKKKANSYNKIKTGIIITSIVALLAISIYFGFWLFNSNNAIVNDIEIVQDNTTKKFGIYNHTIDSLIVPYEYDSILYAGNEMSIMYRDSMQGVCNNEGQIVIPCENQYVFWETRPTEWTWEIPNDYVGNIIPVKHSQNSGWDIYDKYGKRINLITYQDATQTGEPDLIKVKLNDLFGIIDIKGHQIVSCNSTRISKFRKEKAFIEYRGKEDVVNNKGKVLCSFATDYKNLWHFSEGLFAKKNQDGKIGYYDETGKLVFQHIYEQAKEGNNLLNPSFDGDSARISYNGRNGYLYRDGSIKLDAQ